MNSKQAKKLFEKYLNDQCTPEELDLLEAFLASYQLEGSLLNEEYHRDIEKSNSRMWRIIETQIKEESYKKRYPFKKYLGYAAAASIVTFLTTGILNQYHTSESESNTFIVAEEAIQNGSHKAKLTLDDGSEVLLNKESPYQTPYLVSDGETLVYQNESTEPMQMVHNILTIPKGGQYFVQLSDDTKVWLNSETKLKYPVRFFNDKPRTVELVYGEAYFDVSSSIDNNGTKFKVISKGQEIEVLGTQFNIKAYADEIATYTTLVEGKIALQTNIQKKVLKPNQQAIMFIENEFITIKNLEVYNEISWKDGVFSFENKSLKEIMIVLSRWYDMNVEFENRIIENEEFVGIFYKDRSLERILKNIKRVGAINDYEIRGKNVILK